MDDKPDPNGAFFHRSYKKEVNPEDEQLLGASDERVQSWYALLDTQRFATPEEALARLRAVVGEEAAVHNLYADMAPLEIAQSGPLLARIDDLATRLSEVRKAVREPAALTLLRVAGSESDLIAHLYALREAVLPDASEALFRFHDIRIMVPLGRLLDEQQRACVMGPVSRWVMIDGCGEHHELIGTEDGASPPLRITQDQLDALDEFGLTYRVIAQANETDGALLMRRTECEQVHLCRQHLELGRSLGLKTHDDLALFAVLALQFPAGFHGQSPFQQVIQAAVSERWTLDDAFEMVTPEAWAPWNEYLAREDGMMR
jgi:hypothetical protein